MLSSSRRPPLVRVASGDQAQFAAVILPPGACLSEDKDTCFVPPYGQNIRSFDIASIAAATLFPAPGSLLCHGASARVYIKVLMEQRALVFPASVSETIDGIVSARSGRGGGRGVKLV